MSKVGLVVIALLVWATYWAALPWLDCLRELQRFEGGLQICTLGSSVGQPGFWTNFALGVVYLAVAGIVALRRGVL